jgi:hypothetical protein
MNLRRLLYPGRVTDHEDDHRRSLDHTHMRAGNSIPRCVGNVAHLVVVDLERLAEALKGVQGLTLDWLNWRNQWGKKHEDIRGV